MRVAKHPLLTTAEHVVRAITLLAIDRASGHTLLPASECLALEWTLAAPARERQIATILYQLGAQNQDQYALAIADALTVDADVAEGEREPGTSSASLIPRRWPLQQSH